MACVPENEKFFSKTTQFLLFSQHARDGAGEYLACGAQAVRCGRLARLTIL